MTIREWAVDYCFQRGMFETQAKAVVEALIADAASKPMEGRWDEPVDAYPKVMLGVIAIGLNRVAVEWIEQNCPQAWFKSLFD